MLGKRRKRALARPTNLALAMLVALLMTFSGAFSLGAASAAPAPDAGRITTVLFQSPTEECAPGLFVAKIEFSGKYQVGQQVSDPTGTVTIEVTAINGDGEITEFVVVVGGQYQTVVKTGTSNNGISHITFCTSATTAPTTVGGETSQPATTAAATTQQSTTAATSVLPNTGTGSDGGASAGWMWAIIVVLALLATSGAAYLTCGRLGATSQDN